jgi:hypothetical protein
MIFQLYVEVNHEHDFYTLVEHIRNGGCELVGLPVYIPPYQDNLPKTLKEIELILECK